MATIINTQQHSNGFTTQTIKGAFADMFGQCQFCVRIYNLDGTEYTYSLVENLDEAAEEVERYAEYDAQTCWIEDREYYI